ncbi:hypothetical protein BHM03_00007520 [Ensete ventricosum]|nr:hypothetical protein BHM03_00007520 [Ensete ventricosum]
MLGPTTGLELGDSVLFLLFGGSIYCGSRRYLVVRVRWPTRRLEQYGSPFISCDVGAPAGGHPLSHSRIGRMKHRGSRYCRVVRERSPAPRLEQLLHFSDSPIFLLYTPTTAQIWRAVVLATCELASHLFRFNSNNEELSIYSPIALSIPSRGRREEEEEEDLELPIRVGGEREREIDEEEDMIASSSRSSASDGVRKRGRGKRVDSSASATASASDWTDATSEEEERAVGAFRRALIDRNLLPACHDDYHTMKRSVLIADLSYHF